MLLRHTAETSKQEQQYIDAADEQERLWSRMDTRCGPGVNALKKQHKILLRSTKNQQNVAPGTARQTSPNKQETTQRTNIPSTDLFPHDEVVQVWRMTHCVRHELLRQISFFRRNLRTNERTKQKQKRKQNKNGEGRRDTEHTERVTTRARWSMHMSACRMRNNQQKRITV